MRSIKTKLFSLAMAVSMVLALAGCAMSTPSTVGSIGGVCHVHPGQRGQHWRR